MGDERVQTRVQNAQWASSRLQWARTKLPSRNSPSIFHPEPITAETNACSLDQSQVWRAFLHQELEPFIPWYPWLACLEQVSYDRPNAQWETRSWLRSSHCVLESRYRFLRYKHLPFAKQISQAKNEFHRVNYLQHQSLIASPDKPIQSNAYGLQEH